MNDKVKKKRIVNRVGSIYCVTLEDGSRYYLQYIGNDWTQLNSRVVRVFRKKYSKDEIIDLEAVVRGEVWFYAHTLLCPAIRDGFWEKVGSSKFVGDTKNIKFRLYSEGNTNHLTVSHKWYVWTIGEDFVNIGDLTEEYKSYDLGWLYSPWYVYEKIKTGEYPGHEIN